MTNEISFAPYRPLLEEAFARLFGGIAIPLDDSLLTALRPLRLTAGEVLYRQGDAGDEMHVLLSGRLEVRLERGDDPESMRVHLGPGETVGEMAAFSGRRRAATVIAVRDSLLAALPLPLLKRLVAEHPEAFPGVLRTVIDRLSSQTKQTSASRHGRSIFLIPLHEGIALEAFTRRLTRALLTHGSLLTLDADHFVRRFGPLDGEAVRHLDACERQHDFLVLVGDRTPSAWNRLCHGYADSHVLLADARRDPAITAIELWFEREAGRAFAARELVLLHPPAGRPQGTRTWLAGRAIDRHHHLRWDEAPDFARLARHLSGNAIGLVLAGGGARGFAHLGVIRALAHLGIPIDSIGGASFGALIATGPARGLAVEESLAELGEVFTHEDPLGDYTLPITALTRGKALDRLLQRRLPMDIEDLWLPFFAVSSDLSANTVRVHEAGPLWRAIRASVSLPAVLPPAVEAGHILIDGGVLNNLPADVLQRRLRGRLIAVDLTLPRGQTTAWDHLPNGLEYLRHRLLGQMRLGEVPTLSRIMLQVTTLASRKEVQNARRKADLYLNPPVEGFDFLDWERMREIADCGYRHALPRLREWLRAESRLPWRGGFVAEWIERRPI